MTNRLTVERSTAELLRNIIILYQTSKKLLERKDLLKRHSLKFSSSQFGFSWGD